MSLVVWHGCEAGVTRTVTRTTLILKGEGSEEANLTLIVKQAWDRLSSALNNFQFRRSCVILEQESAVLEQARKLFACALEVSLRTVNM